VISTNDLRNGNVLDLDGALWQVTDFQHVKPGKGHAFVRTRLRNVLTGYVLERTFKADERVPQAIIDKREMQLLYREGESYVFMDTQTYEQAELSPAQVGAAASFLQDSDVVIVPTHKGQALYVDLPAAVVLEVVASDPGVKGDRVSGATKPATVSTGLVVQVPLFVEAGDRIKIDTRERRYISRV